MITNELKKKLGLYSLASGAMALAANGNAEAQVTYTDINPDVTVNTVGGSYMLDLNGDGTNDFSINIGSSSSGAFKGLYISPVSGNDAILSTSPSGHYLAVKLDAGTTIPATPGTGQFWGSSAMMLGAASSGAFGPFKNASNEYIGLRLRSGSPGSYTYMYGWLKVSVSYTSGSPTGTISVVIASKAYNATTGYTLTSGQTTGAGTTTAIQQSQELTNNTNVFVNGQNEVSLVNNTAQPISTQLLDINGNLISTKDAGNGLSLLSSGNLAPGMYIVKMMAGDAMASKKVFIQ